MLCSESAHSQEGKPQVLANSLSCALAFLSAYKDQLSPNPPPSVPRRICIGPQKLPTNPSFILSFFEPSPPLPALPSILCPPPPCSMLGPDPAPTGPSSLSNRALPEFLSCPGLQSFSFNSWGAGGLGGWGRRGRSKDRGEFLKSQESRRITVGPKPSRLLGNPSKADLGPRRDAG